MNLQERGGEVPFDPFAGPAIAATAPSTEPQRELWTAARLGREASLAFNESITLRLCGPLDANALRRAVRELQLRHEALRTVFSADGLTLLVSPDPAAALEELQCTPAELDELLARAVERPFDLQAGPLVRFALARLAADDHRLVITAHHIVCDGWSSAVLVRDLAALYRGEALPAAEPFSAYARKPPEPTADDEAYWHQQLSGELPVLELPLDHPRPPVKTYASRREDVRFPEALGRELRKLAARERASLFAVLLAGFKALLHRLSAQEDLIVGIPAAGQAAGGHDSLVGHCVNTLPLRTRLHGGQPFRELLGAVRGTLFDALDHQALTFGALLRKLPLQRDPSRLPLVSVCFNLDKGLDPASFAFPGLSAELSTNPRRFENFDLFVNAVELGDSISLEVQFNTDLFERETLRRWLSAYQLLLARAAADAGTEIAELPVVPPEDAARIAAWNAAPRAEYPRERCAHELFEAQAARTPEAVAAEFEGASLTYAALDARANALAHELRAAGVTRGSLVGLCVERSLDLFVGLLGILKAGGAYLPLDPAHPLERLSFMVADSGVQVLVTQRKLRAELPIQVPQAILVDDVPQGAPALPRAAAPEDPAYLLYTSGSTGKPKGVLVPHRALVNLLCSVQRTPGLCASDVVLAITTLSFDIAASEVLLPLTVGARIVLASRDTASDGPSLLRLLRSRGVTFVDATPATWRLLLAAGWTGGEGLKAICTGEALPRDLAEELLPRVASLWNGYGPTETTVWSTFWQVPRGLSRVLIGKPVANTQAHVLDARRQPVPIGVPGELWIGGDGVSLGYLNRPELTRERFVELPQGRLYRTGDLVRWLPDGNLECLGRNDTQVKLRGFRIELGEIEDALTRHASVRQAAVLLREDRPGDKRLVAYLAPGSAAADAELRGHLKTTLPDYMVPSAFVRLGTLPLTPSGKIDRRSLPAPTGDAADSGADFVAPRTPTEELLAGLWKEALGVGRPSVRDDFFALGGHSLLASQILARLSRDHGIELPFRKMFEAPTIEQFAALIDAGTAAQPADAQGPIPRQQGPAPLSLVQERLWLQEEMEPRQKLVHSLPAAWRLNGPLDPEVLRRSLDEIARRQDALRTSIRLERGLPVQVVEPEVHLALPLVECESEDALQELLDAEARKPVDPVDAPLFRALLVRRAADDHVLFILPHNLVWDGWSFDLFLRELAAVYPALLAGRPSPLAPLPVRYADYAVWHRERVASEVSQRQAAWWRDQLRDLPAPLELPADRPRGEGEQHLAGNVGVHLTRVEVEALTALARSCGSTLYMVLFTAFATVLHRWTGARDLVVGTPVRARNRPELDEVIGLFVNAVVLRARVEPGLTLRQLLSRVRETTLDAFSHQEVPLEALGASVPVLRTFFSLQDARTRPGSIGPLSVTQLHVLPPGAANDLMLWMMEGQGGMLAMANYRRALFDEGTIRRFLRQFRTVLGEAVRDADQQISAVNLLDAQERAQLDALARPAVVAAARRWDEAIASCPPHETAVAQGERRLSWGELDARVTALSQELQGKGSVVASLTRSPEAVIALAAATRAGCTLIPVDSAWPKARRDAVIAAARPGALLDGALNVTVREPSGGSGFLGLPVFDAAGKARIVAVPHEVVASLRAVVEPAPAFSAASPGLDCAALEWMLPLSGGATLSLATEGADPEDVAGELSRSGARLMFGAPWLWRALAAAGFRAPAGFRAVCTDGALPQGLGEPDATALHGSPETGVFALYARGPGARPRPLPGVGVQVLDGEGSPMPLGVPGELALRGVRTGDRAALRADGTVQVVSARPGRARLRGHLVELDEVARALEQAPGVLRAAAALHHRGTEEPRLAAWYVPQPGEAPTDSDLRRALRRTLPEHLIPQLFFELDAMPKDVSALAIAAPAAREFVEPRTEAEKVLASIWREAIGVPRVGVYDNFFDLGGHSLLAFEVLARLEQRTGQRLGPRALLLDSLEQIASQLGDLKAAPAAPPENSGPLANRVLRRLRHMLGDEL